MSTNKSEHLQLHLWEPGDSVLRTEFNENWEKLDASAAQAQADLTAGLAEVTNSLRKVAVGTYTGNGGTMTVKLGFKPIAVFVCNQRVDVYDGYLCGLALSGQPAFEQYNSTKLLILTSTGFQAIHGTNASMNASSYKYNYIAVS